MGYRVKTVSAMTGIPRATLLAWERRYDILDPDRSPSGYREYSDADVAKLRRLKALVDEDYSIGEAVELVNAGASTPPPPTIGFGLPPFEALLEALLAFDRAAADRLLPRLGQVPFQAIVDELFVPMLHELGDRWEHGEVTVAQEHYVSGFCREHLLAMYHGLGGGPDRGAAIACATPPGERHELGLLVLALKLALAGHKVVWLGADLPIPDLCAYLATHRPWVVCLSFTRATTREGVVAFAKALRAGAPPGTEIVLGGHGIAHLAGPLIEGVTVCASAADLEQRLLRGAPAVRAAVGG